MKHLLLLEDDRKDAEKLMAVVDASSLKEEVTIDCEQSLEKGMTLIRQGGYDLLLLDLEFTMENRSAVALIDRISPTLPVIIVSNRAHYQVPLSSKVNVKAFINKANLERDLIGVLSSSLDAKIQKKEPETFVFPSPNRKYVSERVQVDAIRYLEFSNRTEYLAYLTSGKTRVIHSVPFKELCRKLEESGISPLVPVTRNQIINLNHIHNVGRKSNGRIFVEMINMPGMEIYVSKAKEKPFYRFLLR